MNFSFKKGKLIPAYVSIKQGFIILPGHQIDYNQMDLVETLCNYKCMYQIKIRSKITLLTKL